METMASGKAYAVIACDEVKSIMNFDNQNRRSKQADLADHHGLSTLTLIGYLHNENSPSGKPVRLLAGER